MVDESMGLFSLFNSYPSSEEIWDPAATGQEAA